MEPTHAHTTPTPTNTPARLVSARSNGAAWLVGALVALSGCSQLEERASIQGRVCLRTCDDGGLSDVRVALALASDPTASDRPTVHTDATGGFFFANVSSAARYRVEVLHRGYDCAPTAQDIDLDAGGLGTVDVRCRVVPERLRAVSACGINLSGEALGEVDLTGADLTGSDLTGADLTRATLDRATLTGADLTDARLTQATLHRAILSGRATGCTHTETGRATLLIGAQLDAASLVEADLSGVDLTGADLTGADLTGADLSGAVLDAANLTGIRGALIAGCPALLPRGWRCAARTNRTGALIGPGADLTGADLASLNLTGADLTGADLTDADLSGATLIQANLSGADLTGADLNGLRAYNLSGCPAALPGTWRCAPLADPARFVLVGPRAQLAGLDLTDAELGSADLVEADLRDADLTATGLPNADLSGADLTGAILGPGLSASRLRNGCPVGLPEPWRCVTTHPDQTPSRFALIGPKVNFGELSDLLGADLRDTTLTGATMERTMLHNADFTGADLTNAWLTECKLDGATLRGLRGCPRRLSHRVVLDWETSACLISSIDPYSNQPPPEAWVFHASCVEQPALQRATMVSTGLNLTGLDLRNTDLSLVSLRGATLDSVLLTGATGLTPAAIACARWSNTTCPDGTNSDNTNDGTCLGHLEAP